MKKILIVTDNLFTQINGVVTTYKNIKIQAENDGHTVCFISPEMYKHFSMPRYPEVKMSLPFGLGKKIEEYNPDYIHISTEGPLGLFAKLYCDSKKYKYNTSYHTKFPEYVNEMYKIPKCITYSYVRWFHKHSGRVLVTTKSMMNELSKNNFDVDMVIWTRGVDKNLLTPTTQRKKNEVPVVLYVGRISLEKNLDDLCVLQDKYEVRLVGDGPYRKHLEKKYKNVKFLGYKTGKDLANEYINADVFCFPSKTDTFGIVLIEAMSLGTPIAAYPVSGPIDIVQDGLTGYMGDNLEDCINKSLKLNRDIVAMNGSHWTWENCWKIFKQNLIEK